METLNSSELFSCHVSPMNSTENSSPSPCKHPEYSAFAEKARKKSKRKTGAQNNEPLLPPCRICSEKASGFHYGVNTCEACKAFFRRNLPKGREYICPVDGKCEIQSGTRSSCPACRFKKCLEIGMSKTAIKTGRYTHAKRAQDIMEVKGLKKFEAFIHNTAISDTSTIVRIRADDLCEKEGAEPGQSEPKRLCMPEPSVEDLDQIIERITNVHLKCSVLSPEFLAKKTENEKAYTEKRFLQEKLFGPMKPIATEDYLSIYQLTGIDIDGRRDLLANSFFTHFEECIKLFIKFAKSIPGFVTLPINDQTSLLKAPSRFDCWMLLSQPSFNVQDKLYTTFNGTVVSVEDMHTIIIGPNPPDNNLLFPLQDRLQKLQLTAEEDCILAGMCLMSTDSCSLEDADKVCQIQNLLLKCLLHEMSKNGRDNPLFIARVVEVLVEMRWIREKHWEIVEAIMTHWADKVEVPPLLYEFDGC